MYKKAKEGIYFNEKLGRVVEHHGYSTRLHWSRDMIDYLRRNYATTFNEELAGCLGVSQTSMRRKARELGLTKDPAWLKEVWDERRRWAHISSRKKGYPGRIRKGERRSPDTMFKKGHVETDEQKQKRIDTIHRYAMTHPEEMRQRGLKAWRTRLARKANSIQQ